MRVEVWGHYLGKQQAPPCRVSSSRINLPQLLTLEGALCLPGMVEPLCAIHGAAAGEPGGAGWWRS